MSRLHTGRCPLPLLSPQIANIANGEAKGGWLLALLEKALGGCDECSLGREMKYSLVVLDLMKTAGLEGVLKVGKGKRGVRGFEGEANTLWAHH